MKGQRVCIRWHLGFPKGRFGGVLAFLLALIMLAESLLRAYTPPNLLARQDRASLTAWLLQASLQKVPAPTKLQQAFDLDAVHSSVGESRLLSSA